MHYISVGVSAGKSAAHPELRIIEACLDGVHVVLVGYGERDGGRLDDLHAEAVFVFAQPVNHVSTIRVVFGEALEFAMRNIVELLQSK